MIEVHSKFNGRAFDAMRGMMLHEANEHGLPVLDNTDVSLKIESEFGTFGISDLTDGLIRMDVASPTADQLYALRDSLVEQIAHFVPEIASDITWSDTINAGDVAPNFQFATVLSSAALCSTFTRIKMRLSKPDLFDDRAIHFRFLFPPSNTQAPQWPTLAPNGATKWPQGEHALHRPVYTIRAMDEDVATVDIFHHEGGRTWNWARSVSAGEEVAIIGPGGNGVLNAADMILAADETAFPAMARMIEALTAGNASRIVLLSHTGATDYPMPTPTGTTLEWATPNTFANRVEALIADRAPDFLWVGSETAQVTKLRKSTAIAAMDKSDKRLAVYWTA